MQCANSWHEYLIMNELRAQPVSGATLRLATLYPGVRQFQSLLL